VGTNQQRDADMDRLLRAVLKPASHEVAGGCPDAAILAAFVEGSLSPGEQSALESHIVNCGRCQETLAVLSHDLPPELDAAPASAWFTWVTRPRLRWILPITAAATMAAVFLVSRPLIAPDQGTPPADVARMARATPPPAPPAPAAASETGVERDRFSAPPAKPPAESTLKDEAARSTANQASGSKQAAAAAPAPALAGQAAIEKQAVAESVAEPAERAAAGERRARAAAEPAAVPLAGAPAASDISPKAGAAGKMTAADATRAVPVATPTREELRRMEPIATVKAATDGAVRWEFGPGGQIWRSVDAGSTWKQQISGVSANLVAGSAPSATTCWAVGAAGTVLLTTDGERWMHRPFPEAVHLVAVTASSARAATVTTRDGRRFQTLDAGLTWSPR
jgi:hypothetical protein